MKKRTKGLIILAAVLVVAIAATLILSSYNKKQEELAAAADESVKLFQTESAVAEFSYELGGEKLAFEKDASGWQHIAADPIELDTAVLDEMAKMLATVNAEKLVEEGADLAKYGLEKPWQSVRFSLDSGASHVLALGDKNAAVSGVYANIDGSSDVYLLDDIYTSVFASELVTLAKVEDLPVVVGNSHATYMAFENEGGSLALEYFEEPPMPFYTDSYKWFTKVDGKYKPVDNGAIETLNTYFTSFYAHGAVAINPSEQELAKFGLDTPEKLTFGFETDYTDGTKYTEYTLLVGDRFERDGQNYRYAKQEDGKQVVVITAELLENVMGTTYTDVLPVDVCPLLRYQMQTIDISVGGKNYKLEFKRSMQPNENGDEVQIEEYYVNGVKMNSTKFLDWYFILSGMTSEGIAEGEVQGECVLKIDFHRNEGDGFDDMTMEFYKYGTEYYRVVFGGESYMLANKREVEAFMEGITELEPA